MEEIQERRKSQEDKKRVETEREDILALKELK